MGFIRKTLLVLSLLAGIAAGGYWYYQNRMAPAAASGPGSGAFTQVVDVKQGSLSSTVTVVGQIDALQSEDLAFSRTSSSTRLQTLAVQAGNTVKQGDVLATIDPLPYEQALEQARLDLQSAEKTLADLQTPVAALKVAQSDLNVAKARYRLQQAEDALAGLLNPDIAQLQSNVANAQSALAKAQADLIGRQQDSSVKTQLDKLRSTEAAASATYSRLAAETYSDSYYQDRLRLAHNAMLDARDARATFEIQQQASLFSVQLALRNASNTLQDAQAALVEAQAGGGKLALAKAELDLQEARVALQVAEEARSALDSGPDAAALASAQAALDKRRLALADAEAALAGTRLIASFDGTVLKVNALPGDQISPNTLILTVANLSNLQVAASVDETTIRRVQSGQSAQISFDAFPGQSLSGKVHSVPLQGSLQGGVMIYEVPISLEGTNRLPLLVGMTANVRIQTQQVRDALLVPTMALLRSAGQYQVLVPADDPQAPPVAVPVEIGLSDGTNTQITRGLNPGDKVVVQIQPANTTTGNRNAAGLAGSGPVFVAPAGAPAGGPMR
jgi:HlyD family secretion protein